MISLENEIYKGVQKQRGCLGCKRLMEGGEMSFAKCKGSLAKKAVF